MPLPGAVCIAMIWQVQSQGLQMNNNGHLSCEIRDPMRKFICIYYAPLYSWTQLHIWPDHVGLPRGAVGDLQSQWTCWL